MASYKKNLKLIKEHLQNNESIITSLEGIYEKNNWIRKGILVATENRLIFFANKLIGFDLESFPFRNISSYEYGKEFMGHKIKFFASGNEVKVKWINSENLNKFNQYINSNIGQQSNSKEFIQTESVASQLEKIAILLEKNLISEDEFYKMKSNITSIRKEKKITSKQETSNANFTKSDSSANIDPKKGKFKQILKYAFLIFVVAPIVIVIISSTFFDNESPKYDNHKIKYATSDLNLRDKPNIEDEIIKVLKQNDKVITYDSIVNNYIMILDKDSSKIGWASNEYLQNKPLTKMQLKEIIKKPTPTIPKFTILKEDENKQLKKVNIDVRLEKEISKTDLEKIGLNIKENRLEFEKFYIFYYLPKYKVGNGAWATTHFTPKLEVKILGVTKESLQSIDKKIIQGNIISVWKDNDAIMPCKTYLIKENNNFIIKTLFAKNAYSNESEITEKVVKSEFNGEIRLTSDNPHGEYYVLEKNGNLGIYNTDGKFKEAIKSN